MVAGALAVLWGTAAGAAESSGVPADVDRAPPESPASYARLGVFLSGALHDADLQPVNEELYRNGYSLLPHRAMTLGLGASAAWRGVRLVVDGELDAYGRQALQASSAAEWSEARLGVAGGPEISIGAGFLAPLVGFSIVADTLHFPRGEPPFLVTNVGSLPNALSRDSILLDLALAFDYPVLRGLLPTRGTTQHNTAALTLGIRVGYHWQAYASDWYVGPRTLGRSPDFELGSWFVRLLIGGEIITAPAEGTPAEGTPAEGGGSAPALSATR